MIPIATKKKSRPRSSKKIKESFPQVLKDKMINNLGYDPTKGSKPTSYFGDGSNVTGT